MKHLKKFLKITGIAFATLILLLFLIPVLFKKQIQALVKKEINKSLNAVVDFKDAKLSLFKHFPKATIIINGISIVGKGEFGKDTLLSADKVDATANLFSVLKGKNIKVYGLYATAPRINLMMNKFGRANWDIAKASTDTSKAITDTTASNFKLRLKEYDINNGYLKYKDEVANTFIELNELDHNGDGDFTADVFDLSTSTQAKSFYLTQDGIPYINGAVTDIDADVNIDTKNNKYSFQSNDINLNALRLASSGFVRLISAKEIEMDFKFNSKDNDFKSLLSMIPAMYTKDFSSVKTSGKASFNGFVKGIYMPTQLPAYDVQATVSNASFQYPDLPRPVKNISLNLQASNKTGQADASVIDISKGHLEFDNEPFDFHFNYSNPATTQYIDAGAKGKLDLAQLSKFVKLPNGTKLSGLLHADAFAKGPLQALQNMSGNFSAGGFFDIKNLFYSAANFPQPIKNGNVKATINNSGGKADNTTIDISAAHIEVGNDPVDFNLKISQPVSSINFNGNAKGRLTLDNLKQFDVLPANTTLSGVVNADAGFAGSKIAIDKEEYDKITMTGKAAFSNVKYQSPATNGQLAIPAAALTFNNKTVSVDNATANYLGTNLTAKGTVSNLIGYLMDAQTVSGNLTANADKVDVNKWMGVSGTGTTNTENSSAAGNAFAVPANMNVNIQATAGEVLYDKVKYTNLSGNLLLNDESVTLQNVKADALDGNIVINGSYATKINKQKPDINLAYSIKNVDVQKAFYAYNTLQSLMPIGKFLAGKLHSELSMSGNLKEDMFPLLNSLSGKGNLLLLEGVLAKFAPLEKIANALDVDRLKSISVKDIKNFIEFSNGKVLVKPFNVKVQDIEMEIGGFHGFDQSLDYNIKMKLPRSYMGSKGNALVNNLVTAANSKGLPIKASDVVNLTIKLTGNINNPDVKINLKEVVGDVMTELKTQVEDFVKAKTDSLKQKAKDSVAVIKNQAEQKAKEELAKKGIDTVNLNIKNAKDTIIKRVTDTLKTKAKDSVKSKLKRILIGN